MEVLSQEKKATQSSEDHIQKLLGDASWRKMDSKQLTKDSKAQTLWPTKEGSIKLDQHSSEGMVKKLVSDHIQLLMNNGAQHSERLT